MIPIDLHLDPRARQLTEQAVSWVEELCGAVILASTRTASGRPIDLAPVDAIIDGLYHQATPFQWLLMLRRIDDPRINPLVARRVKTCLTHRAAVIELGAVVERRKNWRHN